MKYYLFRILVSEGSYKEFTVLIIGNYNERIYEIIYTEQIHNI